MATWRAVIKQNNRLYSTYFESLSNFGSDAKLEAIGSSELTTYIISLFQ